MKYDPKKLFGYPVLRDALPGEDRRLMDYPKAEFQPDLKLSVDPTKPTNAIIDYDYAISVPELEALADNGLAEFRLTISCRKTFWTESFTLEETPGTITLDGKFLKDQLELSMVLITSSQVEFTSTSFHQDYQGKTISLPKHSILAWHNPITYSIAQERFRSLRTLIDFQTADHVKPGQLIFDGDDDYVTVTVHKKMYQAITLATQSSDLSKAVVLSSIYQSVVCQMLNEMMAIDAAGEDLDSRRWSMVIKERCTEQDIRWTDPSSLASNAQQLLGSCFSKITDLGFGVSQ